MVSLITTVYNADNLYWSQNCNELGAFVYDRWCRCMHSRNSSRAERGNHHSLQSPHVMASVVLGLHENPYVPLTGLMSYVSDGVYRYNINLPVLAHPSDISSICWSWKKFSGHEIYQDLWLELVPTFQGQGMKNILKISAH